MSILHKTMHAPVWGKASIHYSVWGKVLGSSVYVNTCHSARQKMGSIPIAYTPLG